MGAARRAALAGGVAAAGGLLWTRKNPSACPYSQRFWVECPTPTAGGGSRAARRRGARGLLWHYSRLVPA